MYLKLGKNGKIFSTKYNIHTFERATALGVRTSYQPILDNQLFARLPFLITQGSALSRKQGFCLPAYTRNKRQNQGSFYLIRTVLLHWRKYSFSS